MRQRVLPEVDLYASCPYEGPVLPFYQGQFESVYVLLHPFYRLLPEYSSQYLRVEYPDKSLSKRCCLPTRWTEVMQLTGLANFSEVDIGLRTTILGLVASFCRDDLAAKLVELETESQIFCPPNGYLDDLLQDDLFAAINFTGDDWLWVSDEHNTERKLYWIEDLIRDDVIPAHAHIFTPNKTLLVTTHWDSHFSFLCSSRERIEKILAYKAFEGFFCSEATEVYWSVRNEPR